MAPSIKSFRRPPSPTGSQTTSASAMDFGSDEGPRVIVTRADLRASVAAYEGLLATAKAYRNALLAVGTATTAFAAALEECARVKGAGHSGDQLLAASGLQYMIANSNSVLSDTLYRQFEIPLMQEYDSYVASVSTRHAEYEQLLASKTAEIRQTEADNLKQGRKKSRDLSQFRKALEKLQEQVREVEICKRSYYSETLEHETETWGMIGGKVALLLRSTLDLADRLSSKATSDPVIESMLAEHPDPFDSYRLESEEDRDVFTVLPPLGMNLGLGGSKRGSVIDLADKDSDNNSDSATLTTPRQNMQQPQKKRAPGSAAAAEILGISDEPSSSGPGGEGVGPDSPSPKPGSFSHSGSQKHVPTRLSLATTSTSSSGSRTPDALSPTSRNGGDNDRPYNHHPSQLSPAVHLRNASASSIASSTSTAKRQSSSSGSATSSLARQHQRQSRRNANNLSRVSEQEADPMAGDWDPPSYGRTLSPAINGNGGDDFFDSAGEDGGIETETDRTRSSVEESPVSESRRRSVHDDHDRDHDDERVSPGPWA
ncbi:hypothetical protein T439DRAFT_323431 [Meredithblackwellia eburnea MCA 4105]